MWEQVRMFTPDKVKYADQLFGAAEVPWTSPSPLLFSSRRHQKARTHAHTYPHTQVQAELQQQLHNTQEDLEDTRRQGDALREDNRILSTHNADLERQIEDERSAKMKAV